MKICVLLFAGIRERAGRSELAIELEPTATASDLIAAIAHAHPDLAASLSTCRIAVEQEFLDESEVSTAVIPDGAEVALIPPVSGGNDGSAASPHCQLSATTLSQRAVEHAVEHPGAGGVVTFTGNVRAQSRGKTIRFLEYEAYDGMALRVMEKLACELEAKFPETRVCIHHRVGRLEIGEAAVIISASAPHRAEAFEACRGAIEGLKKDVPIWKREVDTSGEEWIGSGP